ncbi:TolC family protein [Rubinisphaera sp. JC750]|uniref:TolC family protein n=1 Tax=Rubinisphaera sp. JC750 TaxID=2898658 RepID=UPI001F00ED29|nr:TolC family protein [Rubinisphaera sp. JC750]
MASVSQRRRNGRTSEKYRSQFLRCGLALIVLTSGCSRSFWRKQADKDTYQALHAQETDPRWVNPRVNVTPDPRSRFFDPYHPDREPLPPDDPAAEQIMDCPGGIPGYKSWHEMGRAFTVENPGWLSQFELSADMIDPETGEYKEDCPLPTIPDLTILDAIELSYLHSRDYQFQIENAYLAALAYTFERFRFQVRYLGIGGGEPGSSLTYENVPGFEDSLQMNNRFGVSQLLPTGGQWAVELANNTLWIFSGPNSGTTSASLLSYRLVQPLLLDAGRKITLENLTQTERDLLYSVRDLARFRKQLFAQTVAGGAGGGYLGLLTQLQGIRNEQYNIRQLERQVRELRANAEIPPGTTDAPLAQLPDGLQFPEELEFKLRFDPERQQLLWAGAMTAEQAQALTDLSDDTGWQAAVRELVALLRSETVPLDVAQLESRLASSIIRLRSAEQRYQDSLDAYKIQLGLPPDLRMTLDDSGLDQFILIDPVLEELQEIVEDFVESTGRLNVDEAVASDSVLTQQALTETRRLLSEVLQRGLTNVERDVDRVNENLDNRLEGITDPEDREEILASINRDKSQLQTLGAELQDMQKELRVIEQLVSQGQTDEVSLLAANRGLQDFREELLLRVQSLQVIQVGLRSELITVNRYELDLDDTTGLALENRLDLMNARAEVVDARRLEEVAANRLKAVMDVIVEGDIRNEPGSGPFDFSGQSSNHRVGVQFTAPLDQVAERNAYRAAQIAYQRARRDYMELEDQVKLDVRTEWRNLQILEQNLETARQALRINVIQYDQAVEESNDPTKTNQGGVSGRNLVDALNDILDSQNALVSIWSDYERSRLNIYRDMGIMEIDPQGVWVDPFYQEMYRQDAPPTPVPAPIPSEPTAGDFNVLLLPPGPAGISNESDNNTAEKQLEPGKLPLVPAPAARRPEQYARQPESEETPFVGDPLGWKPDRPDGGSGAGSGLDERSERISNSGPSFGSDSVRE